MLLTIFAMYWLPTIVVVVRQAHSALGVFLLNFLLGWTVIGWFVALIWALGADSRRHEIVVRVERDAAQR